MDPADNWTYLYVVGKLASEAESVLKVLRRTENFVLINWRQNLKCSCGTAGAYYTTTGVRVQTSEI